MKIAVVSGKGGTGKTLVAVNLAAAARRAVYIDCDVEEPNGHLFFKPGDAKSRGVTVPIPSVDASRCTGCRICTEFCKFNALAYVDNSVQVFAEICHSCGGCALLCPEQAITEQAYSIGRVQRGTSDGVDVWSGFLNPGEPSGVPIIRELLQEETKGPCFIDCPPGSACAVMETIQEADYCILVAEPTIFGVHNLRIVHELVQLFAKPHGAVLNKCLAGDNPAEAYCREQGIEILAKIPLAQDLGQITANAGIAAREDGKYRELFCRLLDRVMEEVRQCSNS